MSKNAFYKVICLVSGAIMGLGCIPLIKYCTEKSIDYPVFIIALVLAMAAALFIQTIIHEAGHLVFGLLSGYSFVSFRVGALTLIKQDGKLKLKRFSLASTSGQCLMSPPEYNGGNYQFVLYNMGGVLMNLIASALFIMILLIFKPGGIARCFIIELIAVGIGIALMNGIPGSMNYFINNDAKNTLEMKRDAQAKKSFNMVLKANALLSSGVRLKDMDEALFAFDDDAPIESGLAGNMLILQENRLMDEKRFDEAKRLIDRVMDEACPVNGINKYLCALDRVYIEMIEKGSNADLSVLDEKNMIKFLRAMKNYPSVVRTQYAAFSVKNDEKNRIKAFEQMKKLEKSHPQKVEVDAEMELMRTMDDVLSKTV